MSPEALSSLGMAALQQGDLERGVQCLTQSLQVRPEQPSLLAIRAVALRMLGRLSEALQSVERATALQPDYPEAYFDRGTILQEMARSDEALASYDRAISLRPDYAEAYNNRATVLQALGAFGEALASYDRSIALRANYADAYSNRGALLRELQRLDEARADLDHAILLAPNRAEAYANRSATLLALGRPEAALADADRAVRLKPGNPRAHTNRGAALHELLRLDEALQSYDRAIDLDPDSVAAHWGKATLKILRGDYEEGWRLYEWRFHTAQPRGAGRFPQPVWTTDQPLAGRTLLIHAEQGLGDVIQFCRYASMAADLGGAVVLEVPKALLTLAATLGGAVQCVEQGTRLPAFDLHCPIMSLPFAFKTRLATIPARVPYLHVLPEKRAQWQARLGAKTGPRIGLVWSGSAGHRNDRNRSLRLQDLTPLLSHPLEFHSIQKEPRAEDSEVLARSRVVIHADQLVDFADTAALVEGMDLVISVDTAVAHLAGALGKPVWILLPFLPDCRWMLNRSDSPWYPSASLFRPPAAGDWTSVIAEVARRLGCL